MKIVIDIPEDAFKYIKDNKKFGWIGDYELAEVIANGIPLADGDLISRQAVLDIFGDIHQLDYNARAYVTQIKELPSAEKTDTNHYRLVDTSYSPYTIDSTTKIAEKTAEWVNKNGIKTCNNCGIGLSFAYYKFCPNCGVRMKGEQTE